MSRRCRGLAWAAVAAALACGSPPPADQAAEPPAGATLPTPFTAEQIRDVWQPGFGLVLRFRSPGREEWQRWTVATADAEGCEIDYQLLGADGQPLGDPDRRRSSWTELRDHALFEVARATRERYVRETPLGQVEGWLYTVADADAGSETRMLFGDRQVGAPVWMSTSAAGEVVLEVTQMERWPAPGDSAPGSSAEEPLDPVE